MKTLYAGSFDPLTLGHMDVVNKALKAFGSVLIVIADSPAKKYMFTAIERKAMVDKIYVGNENVKCEILPKNVYVASYANSLGIKHIVRGLRNATDLLNEQDLYEGNKKIANDIESVFFMPSKGVEHVSSSAVKSFIGYDGFTFLLDEMVHRVVGNEMVKKWIDVIFKDKFGQDYFSPYKDACDSNLFSFYDIGKRHYHNLYHIAYVLLKFWKLIEKINPALVGNKISPLFYGQAFFAILWHDLVVEFTDDDEKNSIKLINEKTNNIIYFSRVCGDFLEEQNSTLMEEMILSTSFKWIGPKYGFQTNLEMRKMFCKAIRMADWMVFTESPKNYEKYAIDIKREIMDCRKDLSELDVLSNRVNFLEKIDLNQFIDFSLLSEEHKCNAFNNIKWEINKLEMDLARLSWEKKISEIKHI